MALTYTATSSDVTSVLINAVIGEQHRTNSTGALNLLAEIRATVDAMTTDYVRKARAEGHSWAAIGNVLGMTRQAAHERFRALG